MDSAASIDGSSREDLVVLCSAFVERAERSGYGELVACASALHCGDSSRLRHVREELAPELTAWAELFYFGGVVGHATAAEALGREVLAGLLDLGVLCLRDGGVASSNLALRRVAGLWYLHEILGANPGIYFGDDSVALLWRCAAKRGDRVLDLCTGPGLQLLHAARCGARGLGVDVNPVALGIAEVNARLNDLHERTAFALADVGAPELVARGPYDLVLANPPLLPFAEDEGYPFVGHGGADGMTVTWRILDALPELLDSRGRAQIIGTTLSDEFAICNEDRLRGWAEEHRLDVLLSITSRAPLGPGTPVFESLVATAAAASGRAPAEVAASFAASNAKLGGTHIVGFFIHARRGRGDLRFIDAAVPRASTFFFV